MAIVRSQASASMHSISNNRSSWSRRLSGIYGLDSATRASGCLGKNGTRRSAVERDFFPDLILLFPQLAALSIPLGVLGVVAVMTEPSLASRASTPDNYAGPMPLGGLSP